MPGALTGHILDISMMQDINFSASTADGNTGRTPYEMWTGQKVDVVKHLKYSYGDRVWCNKPKIDQNNNTSPVELGICLYRTGNDGIYV